RVRMSLMDRTKILFPTISGLAVTFWKLFTGAVVVATAGIYGLFVYLGLAGAEGWTHAELDARIEAYLRAEVQLDIDFEIGDAVDKLRRWGIVDLHSDGTLHALPIDQALESLDRSWDGFF